MRRYLLDSSAVAAYLSGRRAAVGLISPWIDRQEAATSILVYQFDRVVINRRIIICAKKC
jgi:hypothetical protein